MNRIRIFSPHIDDAFLSLGGSILNWVNKDCLVYVYNIFSISNWTSPDSLSAIQYPTDRNTVTKIRKEEEMAVSNMAKFKYEFWDFLDLSLRPTFSNAQTNVMVDEIEKKITQCSSKEDYLFFPIGLVHADHVIVHTIGEKLLKLGYKIFYFEDMPYLSLLDFDYKEFYSLALENAQPVIERINFKDKSTILEQYQSQVSKFWLSSIKLYSYSPSENDYFERYWSTF